MNRFGSVHTKHAPQDNFLSKDLLIFSFSQPSDAHFAAPQIFAVQHVDVCMFSNGKFKNIVAEVDVSKQIGPGETLHGVYSLLPIRGELRREMNIQYMIH